MTLLILSLACAKPSPIESAKVLLTQRGGFTDVSVTPLEGKKGFFTWTGTKGGEQCRGGVEVEKAHQSKPKGRFTSVCDAPYPVGKFTAEESCGETAGGTPVYVVWTLEAKDGRFQLDADGTQTMIRLVGAFREGAMHIEGGHDDLPLPQHLKDKVAFEVAAKDAGWNAVPGALTLNCSESLLFMPTK